MAGLNVFIRRLERIAASEAKEAIAKKVAAACHKAALDGFNNERSPYGERWVNRIQPTGSWKILDKTGEGINSLKSWATGTIAKLGILSRMKFHQTGTIYMTARKFFPEQARGLGNWTEPVYDAVFDAIRGLMYGRPT